MSPVEHALSDVFNPETAVHPLDLTDAAYHTENPWPVYNWLMDEAPLYQYSNGFWYVSRYDDLKAIAMDPVTFTSTEGNRPGLPNDHSFIHLDGKSHHARRGLVQHLFTPAAIKKLDGHITDVVDTLLDEVIESGECEFVEDVAAKLPIRDWKPEGSGEGTGLGFAAADIVLKSLGLQGLQEAAQRAQLDGLLVLWHPAQ